MSRVEIGRKEKLLEPGMTVVDPGAALRAGQLPELAFDFTRQHLKPNGPVLIKTSRAPASRNWWNRRADPSQQGPLREAMTPHGPAVLSFTCWRVVFGWCSVAPILHP